MPFVGGITAFFLSTPAIDFNLTDLADVMNIPVSFRHFFDSADVHYVLPQKDGRKLLGLVRADAQGCAGASQLLPGTS